MKFALQDNTRNVPPGVVKALRAELARQEALPSR